MVAEALASDLEVDEIFHAGDFPEVLGVAGARGISVVAVTDKVMRSLSSTQTPQGIVAVVARGAAAQTPPPGSDLVLVLAQVRDPGNAGTLIRSAVAAGAQAVVFTTESVDAFNPKTVRASAGTLFHLTVITEVTLEGALADLRNQGFSTVAADAKAEVAADELDLTGPVALVVGNEAAGLRDEASLCDTVVRIPMPGPAESLNVAVAGSILLYETVRQRRGVSSTVPESGPSGGTG